MFIGVSACSSIPEHALTTLHEEEVFALKHLPCEAVGVKSPWEKRDYSFLCNMGEWGTINYTFYENEAKDGKVDKAKLMWKEYKRDSFFPTNRESVEIVLGRLSDQFAPNHRMSMIGFASRLNTYTFYTDYVKIKHSTDYYKNTPEPYYLHSVTIENTED